MELIIMNFNISKKILLLSIAFIAHYADAMEKQQSSLNKMSLDFIVNKRTIDNVNNAELPQDKYQALHNLINEDEKTESNSMIHQPEKDPAVMPISIDLDKPEFPCKQCGKVYTKEYNLQNHFFFNHAFKKKFQCNYRRSCKFSTDDKEKFDKHMTEHPNEKFKCDYENCTHEDTTKGNLKRHKSTQHGLGTQIQWTNYG